jgi:HPt (histidine-containing phosphotransfer) domain-containing protein
MPMPDLEKGLASLRANYARSFPSKLAALAEAWRAFDGGADEASARALHVLVHRLAGSAGSYGFAELGTRARAVDLVLAAWKDAAPDGRAAASEVVRRVETPMQTLLDELARHAVAGEGRS